MNSLDTTAAAIRQRSTKMDPGEFCAWAVKRVRKHIPFKSACWGFVGRGGIADLMSVVDLDPRVFASEYGKVAHLDPMPAMLAAAPGTAAVVDTLDLPSDPYAPFIRWAQKLGITQSMAIGAVHPITQATQGIALFRDESQPEYRSNDRLAFEAVAPSLIQGLRRSRENQLKNDLFKQWSDRNLLCTVTKSGAILDLEDRCATEIRREWPNWVGPELPDDLHALLDHPEPNWKYRKGGLLIRALPYRDHLLLVMTRLGILENLTGRQYEIAEMYANGATTAEIAIRLCIEVTTVENHRKNIYARLRVSTNNELTRCFAATRKQLELQTL